MEYREKLIGTFILTEAYKEIARKEELELKSREIKTVTYEIRESTTENWMYSNSTNTIN